MDATAADRSDRSAEWGSGLAVSEWSVVGAAALFLISLTGFDWFAFSVEERGAPGTEGDALRWVDGLDYVLLAAGLVCVTAPLIRFAGLTEATPHRVALITGSAGLIAAIVVTYLIASPPDVNTDLLGAVGGGPTTETIARGGAVIGLAAAVAIAALSGLTLLASPAALAPVRRRPMPAPHADLRRQAESPPPVAPPEPAPPEPALAVPETRESGAKPKPKPRRKPKQAAKRPRTAAKHKRKPEPRAPARPSLVTATAAQLVRVGFTKAQAERIVEYRDDLGKVTKLSDLKRVPGIAKPVLAELVKRLDD